jgi:UDPglucose 6-dehydrogenase
MRLGERSEMEISIIGGGYVGLVSSACFAELGHSVNIIEAEDEKVESINSGRSQIFEKGLDELLSKHAGKDIYATRDYACIRDSIASFICVGTPPAQDGNANLSSIISASTSIGDALRKADGYHVVIAKSTIPPSTTENIIMPKILYCSGRSSCDIGFAMNPEFLREGVAIQDFMKPDRIVIGAQNERAGNLVENLYKGIDAPIIRTSIAAAEMIKYASNAFLAMKISFSNEIGNLCKILGIDVYEVMRGVGMDARISPYFLNAGIGFGGSCFPKDISALICLAENLGYDAPLLKSVIRVNERQPLRIIELLEQRIGDLNGKRIAVLGLAFKKDTDDVRDSRAIPIITKLKEMGAEIAAYDPIANFKMRMIIPDIDYYDSAEKTLMSADACLVLTDWPEFSSLKNEFDLMKSKVILEGRRILSCEDVEGLCW